ncbi:hypothetical protein LTR37_004380 [Vermiconidia calcicola]|uniref:Uncharacterized protein n=1 Tax=Vermiconidia calcicola TaxID=1690605 RepID=A0ACC3NNR4_9PEZI|nr:hypothetical protein LTR37_004380 [Vermiconidia calcicola]
MADEPEMSGTKSQAHSRNIDEDTVKMADAVPPGSSSGSEEKRPEPQAQKAPQQKKKPSRLKQLWEKAELDVMTLQMMVKGSVPPIVAIAMYQADAVAAQYQTLGYLVAIASILGFCIMPRGKFIQHMSMNVLSICFAAAVNLLALYCVTQARIHTTPPGAPPTGYNSSASAVCAIFLMVQVYFINVVRAARPQFQFPAILCSIFVVVSMTYGTQLADMTSANSFMERLLKAFLTGFGLATVTSFVVFPTSSRKVVFKQMAGYLQLMNGVLKTQTAYMASLETFDPVQQRRKAAEDAEKDDPKTKKNNKKHDGPYSLMMTPAAAKQRELMTKLIALHTKLHGGVVPAKREIAVGKLESHDLSELWKLTRSIFLPVLGLTSMMNILERWAEISGLDKDGLSEEEETARHHQLDNLHFLMKNLHEPFAQITGTLDGGFQHILLTLELVKPDKKQKQQDEESKGDQPPKPGTPGFAAFYKEKVDKFYLSKQKTLEDWCRQNGIELPPDFFESSFIRPDTLRVEDGHNRERHQRQLFFTLYLEYLLWQVGKGLLDLVLYVEKRKQEGVFKKSKVIFPGSKTLYKWVQSTWGEEDMSQEDSFTTDMDSGGAESVYLGKSFGKKKDPEHLPPRNVMEKIGEAVRTVPRFFRSDASAFGLRVVAATMTIGIICYLQATQAFFLRQRLLWAMIMVAMSMNRTTGQSFFNFVLRVFGSAIAMVAAYIIWYTVNGHVPGVIVFLWLFMTATFYPILKMPQYIIVAILSLVAAVMIIGYELQVGKIGTEAAETNGQPAYPTYILAPYRLATVAGGIFVAFLWTIFPYPISETTELRKNLSASLYLMCAYYENVHEAVQARVTGKGGSTKTKGSHAYNLQKARMSVFAKLMMLINDLQNNVAFSKLQIRVGGRFPRKEYEGLVQCLRRLLLWTSLASYASMTFENLDSSDEGRSAWSAQFRKIIINTNHTSNRITSLLSLLSSSLGNGQPLPPYLQMPEPFQFLRQMNEIDQDVTSIRHIAEPEYSAFAVMQVVSQSINVDIKELTEHVKNLVGEIDFSFHAKTSSSLISIDSGEDPEDDKSKVE